MKDKVQAMLFIEEVKNILIPVSSELWGAGRSLDTPDMVWLYKEEQGRRIFSNFYFRYKKHIGELRNELVGFYYSETGFGCFGMDINELPDNEYWEAIEAIKQWASCIAERIKDTELKQELLALIED